MAMLATVVSAFSRDGPPRETPGVPSRALSDVGKHAATAALVVALTLPFAEPAWAATYVGNSDVLASIAELKTSVNNLDAKFDNLDAKVNNLNTKIDIKADSVQANVFWAPVLTATIGILISVYTSGESNMNRNQAVAEAKDQVKLGVQEGVQQVLLFLFVGAAISMYFTVKG
jgi:hypothetical protein